MEIDLGRRLPRRAALKAGVLAFLAGTACTTRPTETPTPTPTKDPTPIIPPFDVAIEYLLEPGKQVNIAAEKIQIGDRVTRLSDLVSEKRRDPEWCRNILYQKSYREYLDPNSEKNLVEVISNPLLLTDYQSGTSWFVYQSHFFRRMICVEMEYYNNPYITLPNQDNHVIDPYDLLQFKPLRVTVDPTTKLAVPSQEISRVFYTGNDGKPVEMMTAEVIQS